MRPEGNNPENKNEVQTPHPSVQDVRVGTSPKFRAPDFFHYIQLVEELGQLLRLRYSEHTD